MTRKKFLKIGVVSLSFIGLLAFAFPFLSSMQPSEAAYNALPHINIKSIEPGQYIYVDSGQSSEFGYKWLIIKNHDKSVAAYTVPIYKGLFMLPDLKWFQLGGTCIDFRPEVEHGFIKKDGIIKCHDTSINDWYKSEWEWLYNGKNLGKHTEDLLVPHYTIENNNLIMGKF